MSAAGIAEHVNKLGRTAKDKVTGFKGVITSVSFDLYGCVQIILTPKVDADGKQPDGRWFDANRLEIAKKRAVMPVPDFLYAAESETAPQSGPHGPAEKPDR